MSQDIKIFLNEKYDFYKEIYTVMVIDDVHGACDMICKYINAKCRNIVVFACYSPKAGIKLMKREYFDIIICDMKMPEIDGHEVIKQVKSKSPTTYTIATTAYGTRMAYLAGKSHPDDFFPKLIEKAKKIELIIEPGLRMANQKRNEIFNNILIEKEQGFDHSAQWHWRERCRRYKKFGWSLKEYLNSRKRIKAVIFDLLDNDFDKEEMVVLSGFSSYQHVRNSAKNLLRYINYDR